MSLKSRWDATVADVAACCEKAGRKPEDVRIIAVSKTVGADVVAQAIECGMHDFGENRTIPFNEKYALYPEESWHLIGQLQSRKAKDVVGKATLIHSLDRTSLLEAIQKSAEKLDVVQDVLVEVSISGEESKGGIRPEELPAFLEAIDACNNVRCQGLMTMAPQGDMDIARRTFEGLRKLAQRCAAQYATRDSIAMKELSMGMSEDYAVAIEQGATMVRVGRRIFSDEFEAALKQNA